MTPRAVTGLKICGSGNINLLAGALVSVVELTLIRPLNREKTRAMAPDVLC